MDSSRDHPFAGDRKQLALERQFDRRLRAAAWCLQRQLRITAQRISALEDQVSDIIDSTIERSNARMDDGIVRGSALSGGRRQRETKSASRAPRRPERPGRTSAVAGHDPGSGNAGVTGGRDRQPTTAAARAGSRSSSRRGGSATSATSPPARRAASSRTGAGARRAAIAIMSRRRDSSTEGGVGVRRRNEERRQERARAAQASLAVRPRAKAPRKAAPNAPSTPEASPGRDHIPSRSGSPSSARRTPTRGVSRLSGLETDFSRYQRRKEMARRRAKKHRERMRAKQQRERLRAMKASGLMVSGDSASVRSHRPKAPPPSAESSTEPVSSVVDSFGSELEDE